MENDPTKPSAYLAIITSFLGIILTILGEISLQTLIVLIVLTTSAVAFSFMAYYSKTIKKNLEDIDEIKRNINIAERLSKLELEVFKK